MFGSSTTGESRRNMNGSNDNHSTISAKRSARTDVFQDGTLCGIRRNGIARSDRFDNRFLVSSFISEAATTAGLLSRRKGSVLPLRRFPILRKLQSTLSSCPARSTWSRYYATVGWWTGYALLLQKRDGRHPFVQGHFCWPTPACYMSVAPLPTRPHAHCLESVIPR
jgi:hypothetical protein